MNNPYYEVQLECYNAKGNIYFAENYRYVKRQAALQKLNALKRHHPSSSVVLVERGRPVDFIGFSMVAPAEADLPQTMPMNASF